MINVTGRAGIIRQEEISVEKVKEVMSVVAQSLAHAGVVAARALLPYFFSAVKYSCTKRLSTNSSTLWILRAPLRSGRM